MKTNSSKRNEYLDLIEKMSADKLLLLKQKSEIQDSLTESRSGLQDCREKYHQLQMQLQSCQSEISAARSNVDRLVQQNQQFSVRSEDLNKSVEAALEPMAALENSLQQLLQSRSQNEQSLAQSQETVTTIDNRQREFESEKNKAQQATDEARDLLEAQRMQCQELKIRSNTIEEQLQNTDLDIEELTENLDPAAERGEWQKRLETLGQRIERLGPINLAAIDEHKEQSERKQYLDAQNEDLVSALTTLESAIRKIDQETKDRFKDIFDQVNKRIGDRFPKLFGGGEARLELTENDLLNTGVMIMARPPGKRITNLQLLSGGEKALTAVALIFSIFELNPSPFCMLDEVDAPLDDANVGRFCAMVEEMSEQVQFIMISHNKITIELAMNLNGVTMHEPGVSRLVSVDVGEAVELAEA